MKQATIIEYRVKDNGDLQKIREFTSEQHSEDTSKADKK